MSEKQYSCLKRNDVLNNRYVLQSFIAKGTFGKVFKAYDTVQKKDVALKRMDHAYREDCEDEVKNLKLANQHNTPGRNFIVTLIDCWDGEDSTFMVMELLGMNITELVDKRRGKSLSMKLVRKVAHQILMGLGHLSRIKLEDGTKTSLIHTDIKPDNIMVASYSSNDIKIKICDFGLAVLDNAEKSSKIQPIGYRAPEVMLHLDYDAKVDVWGATFILLKLLTCKSYFDHSNKIWHMTQMVDRFGMLPKKMIDKSPEKDKYFKKVNDKWELRDKAIESEVTFDDFLIRTGAKYKKEHGVKDENLLIEFFNLLRKMTIYDPTLRIKADDAVKEKLFIL